MTGKFRLTAADIEMMTEGQREIFYEGVRVGAENERKATLRLLKDVPQAIAILKKEQNEKA
jgi:hypothetical protein